MLRDISEKIDRKKLDPQTAFSRGFGFLKNGFSGLPFFGTFLEIFLQI
jgi:hypothetical protein